MTNLDALINAYADLKNKEATLAASKKALEASLSELPAGAYESELYRLSISDSLRSRDSAQLAADIKAMVDGYRSGLSRQYLTAHTIETTVRIHRVGVRTGRNLAA
jgi:prophage DNA circulation protein